LVGYNFGGSITNSYATAFVSGEGSLGGLVGQNSGSAMINNSYAIGDVTTTAGGMMAGVLVGSNERMAESITRSYARMQEGLMLAGFASVGSISNDSLTFTAAQLQSPISANSTNSSDPYYQWSTDNWDFRGTSEYPVLRYAEGDDANNPACFTSTNGAPAGLPQCGSLLTLPPLFPLLIPCTLDINVPDDEDGTPQAYDIDKDNDGLIEICDLEGLHAMRHQLGGAGYQDTTRTAVTSNGCADGRCIGYELARSLDFKEDPTSYRSGEIDNKAPWQGPKGWQPIGTFVRNDPGASFSGVFEGNGHTISDLFSQPTTQSYVGLFGCVGYSAGNDTRLSNIGLLAVDIRGLIEVGALAGCIDARSSANPLRIINSYVFSGRVRGLLQVGGLVGVQTGGTIMNSYAGIPLPDLFLEVEAERSVAGGLVGRSSLGKIINSYSGSRFRGNVNIKGGLVGSSQAADIVNSYFSGSLGTSGGGLVGSLGMLEPPATPKITRSYYLKDKISNSSISPIDQTPDTIPMGLLFGNEPQTATALQTPTTPSTVDTGVYYQWNTDAMGNPTTDWSFGTTTQYPALNYAIECSKNAPLSDIAPPKCGTLLGNQRATGLTKLELTADPELLSPKFDTNRYRYNVNALATSLGLDLEAAGDATILINGMEYAPNTFFTLGDDSEILIEVQTDDSTVEYVLRVLKGSIGVDIRVFLEGAIK